MKTLIAYCSENIGQMTDNDHANDEVNRMNKQSGNDNNRWHKDYSEQMYCPDETDEDVHNPCKLGKGDCWITDSTIVEDW